LVLLVSKWVPPTPEDERLDTSEKNLKAFKDKVVLKKLPYERLRILVVEGQKSVKKI
jgi:hypothetical protein